MYSGSFRLSVGWTVVGIVRRPSSHGCWSLRQARRRGGERVLNYSILKSITAYLKNGSRKKSRFYIKENLQTLPTLQHWTSKAVIFRSKYGLLSAAPIRKQTRRQLIIVGKLLVENPPSIGQPFFFFLLLLLLR